MDPHLANWAALGLSLLILGTYEAWLRGRTGRAPHMMARSAHALLRQQWVNALSSHAGSEVLAVQALRNSLMSSTITASTAAIMLMGGMSLALSNSQFLAHLLDGEGGGHGGRVRLVVMTLMLATLFATYVCSAMSMRYFNHAGFVMSMPVGSAERQQYQPMCLLYVTRGGLLYGWGLRCFLFTAPLLTGLFMPLLMPLASALLVWLLRAFDQAGPTSAAG
jgi:hypothetical protein